MFLTNDIQLEGIIPTVTLQSGPTVTNSTANNKLMGKTNLGQGSPTQHHPKHPLDSHLFLSNPSGSYQLCRLDFTDRIVSLLYNSGICPPLSRLVDDRQRAFGSLTY